MMMLLLYIAIVICQVRNICMQVPIRRFPQLPPLQVVSVSPANNPKSRHELKSNDSITVCVVCMHSGCMHELIAGVCVVRAMVG
jgi:hypothetical protein